MKSWPKAIFLEASILFKLPLDIVTAEIQQLMKLSGVLETSVCIPEISLLEWIPKRIEAVEKHIRQAETGIGNLTKIFSDIKKTEWSKNKNEMLKDTEKITREIVQNNKIGIIATPNIDINSLISMSIQKKRPFEEGNEKGFRDTLNLFTVLEFAKSIKEKDASYILVAEDSIYSHEDIQKMAKDYKIELIVLKSISQTIDYLDKYIKDVKQVIDSYRKSILTKFILDNKDKIENFIRQNVEFAPSSLNKSFALGFAATILEISDIKLIKVNTITRWILSKGFTEGKIMVSSTISLDVIVKVRNFKMPPEPKIKVGDTPSSLNALIGSYLAAGSGGGEYQFEDKIVNVDVSLEGAVYLKKEKDKDGTYVDKYSNLEIYNTVI